MSDLRFTCKHGCSKRSGKTAEYKAWMSMKHRCLNPNATNFKHYGGRGIKVCDRWANSFQAFLDDMGKKPTARHTLDRIGVHGNYEPGNCRWATHSEQSKNKKNSMILTFQGKTQCESDWCAELGLPRRVIFQRIKKLKWSVEKALTTPLGPSHHRNRPC